MDYFGVPQRFVTYINNYITPNVNVNIYIGHGLAIFSAFILPTFLLQLVPVGYGINKLVIICTVEDAKVSIEELQEKIEAFEDFVQSCDVAAMNKI